MIRIEGVDASDYGVVGDAATDDTAALQMALNAAAGRGPVCYLPPGRYRLGGALSVPAGVTLLGASGGAPHSEHPTGTVLLAYGGRGEADGEPLVTLGPNAGVRGLTIHYPEQAVPDVAPYPWSIRVDGELCQIIDVTLTNPYQALDLGTCRNELHTVRNVFGCPLQTGAYIDRCTDIGRLENVHFNPNFWTRSAIQPAIQATTAVLKAYQEQHLVGFKIGKTDWEYISNSFVIFPGIGFHFDDFGYGPGNAEITQSGADICPVAVRVDRVQDHAGVAFVNGQFMARLEVGAGNEGPVKLSNCGFWGTPETGSHVVKDGPSTLVLTGCHLTGWDAAGEGEPCIVARGGRLIVNGCDFMDEGKPPLRLEEGLVAAAILGNTFRGRPEVAAPRGAQVEMAVNTTL